MESNKNEEDINQESFSNEQNNDNNYLQNKINNEELEEEEEEIEEEMDPSKEIALLYESLVEMYSKKQYKKILEAMVLKADKEGKFNLMEWKLIFLRTRTIQRVLEKKNLTYYKSSKIPHFFEYIKKENSDINHWLSFTQELSNMNEKTYVYSFIEFIILFLLQKCITLSKYYIHFGYLQDAIAILALAVRLITKAFYSFKSPDSFALCGEIFLYISSFMIAEGNFNTAINFINYSIKCCYLSLELKLFKNGIKHILFDLNEYKNEIPCLSKNLFNLSLAFYQLGVCYENDGDPYNAFFANKTSKFFLNIINDKKYYLFKELIKDIEIRLLMRSRISIFFERCVRKEELEEKEIKVKKVYNILYKEEEKIKKRFKKIQNKVEKIKLTDVDDDEPDLFRKVGCKPLKEKVLKTTKQIQLLNYLMSNDFKEVINQIKKVEINKLEKDTVNKIQRKIISLKNNEREKLDKKNENALRLIQKLEEKKKQEENKIKENEEKNIKIIRKNQNKSNTMKSNSIYSITTTITKKPRISSAFRSVNMKTNLLTFNSNQSNKTLKTYNEKPTSNDSISIPSRFLSLNDNYSTKKKHYYSRDRILNSKRSKIFNQKYKNNKSAIGMKSFNQRKIFDYRENKVPRYNYNHYYFNKKFKKKYNYLESQYDKEIAFQKQLLKTKFVKEESGKPEPVNVQDIQKKVEHFYFYTFENELMNAKESKIVFDKTDMPNSSKKKLPRRIVSAEQRIFSHLIFNQNKETETEKKYLDENQIKDVNDDTINVVTNKILEITNKEKLINKKKRDLLLK